MSELKHFYSDAGVWLGSWRNVVVSFWGPDPTIERLGESRDCNRQVVSANAGGILGFSIIPQLGSNLPRLGPEHRKIIAETVAEFKDHTIATASVLEGSGFWVSAARAILTGVAMLSSAPTKTFQDQGEAVGWLRGKNYLTKDADVLLAALQEARTHWSAICPGLMKK